VAYGMSDFGLAERLHIDRETARQFIADYFAAYEGIRRYTIEIRILARDQGYVTTLLGRRRYLPELTARNAALRAAGERMAINMPIQGTAADGIKLAMVRLDAAMRERQLQSRMLLQVHDELVFETDADERDELAALAAATMEGALPLDVPLTVDLKVGTDWDRMGRLVTADGGYQVVSVDSAEVEEAADAALVLADV
jgi:DNA polymerase-1